MKRASVVLILLSAAVLVRCSGSEATLAENTSAACRDGADNDGNGASDCNDPGCAEFVFCKVADGGLQQDCTGIEKAAGPTAACCLAYGVDACGAGLHCAALESRTIPVCYFEKSVQSGGECTSDNLCMTGVCDLERRRCKKGRSETCSSSDDCGLLPMAPFTQMACSQYTRTYPNPPRAPSCGDDDVSNPSYREACLTDEDCQKGRTGLRTLCTDGEPAGYRFCNAPPGVDAGN